MRMTTSFTGSRGVRYPAPDVARGFMLLLIAVANVPSWNKMPNGAEPPVSSVDGWWMFVRTLVVDHRAYPLFAMLFGFGLMTMINRRIASGTETYLASLPGAPEGREPMPHEAAWAREMATIDAYRLVRRRGWWMLLIGFVHGLVFPGDIIGAYGLVAVLLANLLARKNYSVLYLIGGIISVLALVTYLAAGTLSGGDTLTASGEQSVSLTVALLWVVTNALQWAVVLVVQVLIALIVPAAVIGARLADTDLLTHPERHRRLLISVGLGGLVLGALAAFHGALTLATTAQLWPWDFAMTEFFGLAGACGWLALLALYAGGPRPDGRLTGLRRLASAVGRRSMTVYLSQTILFGIIFGVVPLLVTGRPRPPSSPWVSGWQAWSCAPPWSAAVMPDPSRPCCARPSPAASAGGRRRRPRPPSGPGCSRDRSPPPEPARPGSVRRKNGRAAGSTFRWTRSRRLRRTPRNHWFSYGRVMNTTTSSATSFTGSRSLRYPAPDVARGSGWRVPRAVCHRPPTGPGPSYVPCSSTSAPTRCSHCSSASGWPPWSTGAWHRASTPTASS